MQLPSLYFLRFLLTESFSLLVIKGLKFNFDIGSIFERNFDPSHLQTVIIPSIVRVNDAWSSFDFSNNEPPWWKAIFFTHTSSCRLMQCSWLSSVDLKTLCKNILSLNVWCNSNRGCNRWQLIVLSQTIIEVSGVFLGHEHARPRFEVPYLIFVAGESLFRYPPASNIKNEFAFWYHVYNLESVKITHGRVLLLIKLLASAWLKGHMKYSPSVCLFGS